PFHLDDFVAAAGFVRPSAELLRPQENITRRLQTEQNRAGAVIVRFVVARRRPLRQMADQTISGKLELGDAHAGAFYFALIEIRRLNVHDEISFPDMLHARLVTLLSDVEKTVRTRI